MRKQVINQAQKIDNQSVILWFTGLSGPGKTTLAYAIDKKLQDLGHKTKVLDGDEMRSGLCQDLGFSHQERTENIRRIAHVGKLFVETNHIVLVAVISPFSLDRKNPVA